MSAPLPTSALAVGSLWVWSALLHRHTCTALQVVVASDTSGSIHASLLRIRMYIMQYYLNQMVLFVPHHAESGDITTIDCSQCNCMQ